MTAAAGPRAGSPSTDDGVAWGALEDAARRVRDHAYAPYSGYHVGAAIVTRSGRVFAGCNVENASYGLAICAERSAIAQMVAAGESDPVAVVVVTRGPEPGSPCGMCRQTLAEFAHDLPVVLVNNKGARVDTSLDELFPMSFTNDYLEG